MAKTNYDVEQIFIETDRVGVKTRNKIWRAFRQFLGIPFLILIFFLILAVVLISLEKSNPLWIQSVREAVEPHLLIDSDKTSNILGIIAAGLITQNSIVISILMLVLQRVAGSMGNLIYDQFLRRHRNQVYLGFVMGLILLVLLVNAAVTEEINPIFSALIIITMTTIEFFLLVWFLYSAISQMRPETIVGDIRDNIVEANSKYQKILNRCRKQSHSSAPIQAVVHTKNHGYVSTIKLDRMEKCLEKCDSETEIIAHFHLGDYLSYGSEIFSIKSNNPENIEDLSECLQHVVQQKEQKTIGNNPKYGFEQLETMAWTSGSTAMQNPETILIVLHGLQSALGQLIFESEKSHDAKTIAFHYEDSVIESAANVLESLAIVSSESLQHQTFAEVLDNISLAYPYVSDDIKLKFNDVIKRILSALGDHVLSKDLEKSLTKLSETLSSEGNQTTTQILRDAHHELSKSIGQLANKSTRVKAK